MVAVLYKILGSSNRLLIQAELEPIQGQRFQPTGFPDLGAAEIITSDNQMSLLVESAQSMANRLEDICLNSDKTEFVEPLQGLSMISVKNNDGKQITNSVREAHRTGSFYILEGEDKSIREKFKDRLKKNGDWDTNLTSIAPFLFELDVCSLLHGVWIAKKIADGRIKLVRALSSFIEAKNVKSAVSGGVKIDHVDPSKNEETGGASEGQGNVPFSRVEYTAESITAFFNLDIQYIKSYGLKEEQTELLLNLALWKIRKFLEGGLRLRTACDLQIKDTPKIIQPKDFVLPEMSDLDAAVKKSINACKDHLADPITEITYEIKKKTKDS